MKKEIELYTLGEYEPKGKMSNTEVNNTSKYATKEENVEMINRLRNGEQIFDIIIERNMGLVRQIAYRYTGRAKSFTAEDLIQEGIIGLIKAIDGYDEEKGAFSTYATNQIKASIIRALDDKDSLIREPVHFKEKKRNLKTYIDKHGDVDDEQIKRELGFTDETFQNIQKNISDSIVSLNELTEDEKNELGNFVQSTENDYEKIFEVNKAKEIMVFLRQQLKPFYYYIFYYRIPPNKLELQDIGLQFATSKEFIHQRKNIILKELENYIDIKRRCLRIESPLTHEEYAHFDKLRITPMDPKEITLYLYIRALLSEYEKLVYKELHFSKWKDDLDFLAARLKKHPCHIIVYINRINEIITKYTTGSEEASYDSFHNSVMKEYHSKIYKIDIDNFDITPYIKTPEPKKFTIEPTNPKA